MNLNLDGSLYELVSRGNKDVYFQEDSLEAQSLFDNRYGPSAPVLHELRRIPALNTPDFGRSSEFQLEIAGDVIVSPTLIIDLPTWLPAIYADQNQTSVIQDASGVTYGYTRGIGFFLFERIQILQDNILLQEFSGDALWIQTRARNSLNHAFLDNQLTGIHSGTALAIGRNATPGRLRLQLPLVGTQSIEDGGFPMLKLPNQSYKIRIFLRKLEDLVEASDGREKPTPWDRSNFQIQTVRNGPFTTFATKTRDEIGTPHIELETRHIYTSDATREKLKEEALEIPFERIYENIFSQNPLEYASAAPLITRRLDARHPCSRIILAFRSWKDMRANQLWKISSDISGGEYYSQLKLLIAGRDRESLWTSLVWKDLVNHAKEERDSGMNLATMNFGLGDKKGSRAPTASRQPDGTINMTTADRPTLFMELTDIVSGQKRSELRVIVETWAVFVAENNRGTLLYAN
jgi:hypothetical protein